jgi:hypothetical protein
MRWDVIGVAAERWYKLFTAWEGVSGLAGVGN